ncbi:MAG: hypothetical protein H8E86_02605 [Planctomycetes bacterium]|nr:hypothetical protein [Planctomycetota bacterium]
MSIYSKIVSQILTITILTAIVVAQPSRRGGGFSSIMGAGGMTPDYMLRDLQRFVVTFDLADEQKVIVEQILRDYDESFREASDSSQDGIGNSFRSMRGDEDDPYRQARQELRDKSNAIRDKLDAANNLGEETGMQELRDRLTQQLETIQEEMRQQRVDQWQSPQRQTAIEEVALLMHDQLRLKKQMREEFEGDLVAVLTEEQLLLWPALERQLIRDRLLPRGRLSGETTDIMSLLEQQDYEDEVLAALLPAIQEWDVNVTDALVARDDHLVENQGTLMSAMRTMDTTSGIDVLKMQGRLAETVRYVNDTAVQNILVLLPKDKVNQFDAVSKQSSYPRIYRPSRTDRAYEAALELEGLEPETMQVIMDYQDSMESEIAIANEQLLSATHQWESKEQVERMERFAQRMTGGSSERQDNPIQQAEENKRTIEDMYLDLLRGLLTEEQIEELGGLEKRSQRDDRGRGRGNREGGRDRGGNDRNSFNREEFMKQFDKDGNGEISESEREAIREHFRNGGSRGGQRGDSRGQGGGQGASNGDRGGNSRSGESRGGSRPN